MLFSNCNNLEIYEIEGIFGDFGKVISVRQANDKGGIHFVTFETYDEAKNAVEGLIDDPDIRLKVFRNKDKKLSYNRRRENFNDSRYNRNNDNNHSWINGSHYQSAPRDLTIDDSRYNRNNNNNHSTNYQRKIRNLSHRFEKARSIEGRINACDDYRSRDENVEYVTAEKSGDENIMDTTINRWHQVSEKKVTSIESVMTSASNESLSLMDFIDDENDGRNLYEDCTNEEPSSLNHNMQQILTYDYQLSESVNDATIDENEKFIESMVIDKESDVVATVDDNESVLSLESVEMIIEKASEVIIGNVDLTRTNEAYLLHLFDKYEPIAVSQLIPITPHNDLGYCSIYFKSHEIAVKVEKNYDKMCLDGRQIIVQRPNRLFAAYLQWI